MQHFSFEIALRHTMLAEKTSLVNCYDLVEQARITNIGLIGLHSARVSPVVVMKFKFKNPKIGYQTGVRSKNHIPSAIFEPTMLTLDDLPVSL